MRIIAKATAQALYVRSVVREEQFLVMLTRVTCIRITALRLRSRSACLKLIEEKVKTYIFSWSKKINLSINM